MGVTYHPLQSVLTTSLKNRDINEKEKDKENTETLELRIDTTIDSLKKAP